MAALHDMLDTAFSHPCVCCGNTHSDPTDIVLIAPNERNAHCRLASAGPQGRSCVSYAVGWTLFYIGPVRVCSATPHALCLDEDALPKWQRSEATLIGCVTHSEGVTQNRYVK